MCFMPSGGSGGTVQATAGTSTPENVESLSENRFRRKRLLMNDGGTGPGGTGEGGGLGGNGPGDSAAGDSTGPW